MQAVQDRTTKYTSAVREFLAVQRHATNTEILAHLQAVYPDISATTVHRITARLYERGELQLAVLVIRPDDPIGDKMRADAEKDDPPPPR